ncbi:RNA polymerase sigma factor [Mesorhizobium sp. B2-3-4]|uniref:RNA polymerase sigma factor n=1 Tax=Mesorhizobium sp. B2-3-4 TaxID=2589959 RepID=UPI00112EE1A9|nr:RNA polymerase sigma factor [Mesorhizobium sp. B2-3-4]TPM34185.1 RNA polymerase sigma factor [Mesorhizobium sp. B2-3-4]
MRWDLHGLFVSHAREIDRFLRRRGHTAETAADLTQDTFVRVMTATPGGKEENPRAYLWRIARNLSIDLKRRERIVEHVHLPDDALQRIADSAPSPEAIVYDRQRLAIVEQALLDLPERTRIAFEMHRLGEKTMSEVAVELGLSTSRTWTLIRRAYQHLRARLKDDAP